MKTKHKSIFFKKNDEAVAGIIVALLVIGLIVVFIAYIQTILVPQWMEQKEAEHMSTVFNQFTLFKYSCDLQAISKMENLALTTSIPLGNKELHMFQSSRSYGSLQLDRQQMDLNVNTTNGDPEIIINKPGIVQFKSENVYFIDKTYTYEYGALITSQYDGAVMAITPNFHIKRDTGGTINITFNIINTEERGGKKLIAGHGTYPLQVRWKQTHNHSFEDVRDIYIPTDFYPVWESYLNATFKQAQITGGYEITRVTNTDGQTQSLRLTFDDLENVKLQLQISTVEVQVGLGWVE